MQAPPHPPLRTLKSGQIFKKDAEWAEQNEKRNDNFLQFLFFELWEKIHGKFTIFWVQK